MFRDRTRPRVHSTVNAFATIIACQSVLAHTEQNGACCLGSLQSVSPRITNSAAITEPRSSRFTARAMVPSRFTSVRVTLPKWDA